jgi:CheY-like chemotaxis protein
MLSAILLVDDDPTTNFINERLLRRLRVSQEVLVAINGQIGLEILKSRCIEEEVNCPDLVLLDVKMPVMNGFEFLEAYTRLPVGHAHPIIVLLTSTQLDQDLSRLQHLPVTDYLTKPLTTEKVSLLLDRHFSN